VFVFDGLPVHPVSGEGETREVSKWCLVRRERRGGGRLGGKRYVVGRCDDDDGVDPVAERDVARAGVGTWSLAGARPGACTSAGP
jgi:hypothetical protein